MDSVAQPAYGFAMIQAYYTTSRPDMLDFVPELCGRVLEVGCASGGFSSQLNASETWGIEPNAEAAKLAEGRINRIFNGTYEQVADELPDSYFDLIVANDVIEHMPDHDYFLQAVKSKLAPNGRLIGSLPNMRHITAMIKLLLLKDWPYRDEGILDRTHLRFFTHKSIIATLERNGFAIDRIKGTNGVIRNGFVNTSKAKDIAGRIATTAVVVGSLGYYADVQYPQYAFSAKVR